MKLIDTWLDMREAWGCGYGKESIDKIGWKSGSMMMMMLAP